MNISSLYWVDKIYESINFDNLPHGIVINGPNGIGKELLAIKISSKLLVNKSNNENISISKSNNHPDFFVLDKEKILIKHIAYREDDWDEEIGKRNVNDFLSVTPSISLNKVALILNAQSMNDASQNALLKSLEEPAPNSYIIMTTNRPKSLLDTIYSRCQVITIPSLSEKDINEWLINNGISDINANDFPSFISPLNILDDIQNNQHLNFRHFIEILNNFIDNKINQESAIKEINNLEINLITKTNYLIEFLRILLKSRLLSETLSGIYEKFNSSSFNNLKISNLINELNNLRYDFFKVPQINENHVLNYFFNELKNSIKI
tara:strand:- start:1918 stop:2883 length:966 start_codon:yes stop_codon:yes gene_type:complete